MEHHVFIKKRIVLLLSFCMAIAICHAQSFDADEDFESFRKSIRKDFENFRTKINKEYAEFMRNPWKEFKEEKPVPKPKDETTPPVVAPKDDTKPAPKPKPVPIEEVIPSPKPIPQPKPVEPIEETPVTPVSPVQPSVSFTFFGTADKVRFDKNESIRLSSLNENTIADAWLKLSGDSYNNIIHDCLEIRTKYGLCDWAYLQMLKSVSETIYGKGTNESVLLTAYIYCQSGYQMRLAIDGSKLHLLLATRHQIFEHPYFRLDGMNLYPFLNKGEEISNSVHICAAAYPKEKAMSLLVSTAQDFTVNYNNQRVIKSKLYPEVSATVKINQNLVSFYDTYPTSMVDENIMTRWAMYANTPMAKDVAKQLYPQLKTFLDGKTQSEAVNILLNWVQTGFVYEYDDKVWGGDRAFFAEESLNYPYCDCEDRSILFTRLVRDLLGLKCILIFYPGHLAAAVCFSETVNGDYIQLNGQRFIVTDPTYIGAPVGYTMPDMDNKTAKVILLE